MTFAELSREHLDKFTDLYYGLLRSTGLFSDKWIDDSITYEKDLHREVPIKVQDTFNRLIDNVQAFINSNPFLVRNPWIITAAQAVLAITLLPFAVALAAGTTAFVSTLIPNYFVNVLSSATQQATDLFRLIFKGWAKHDRLDAHGKLVPAYRWVRSPLDFASNFVKIMFKLATTPVRVIRTTVQESARNALDAAKTVLNWPLFVILQRPLRKLFGFEQSIYDAAVVQSHGDAIYDLEFNVRRQREILSNLSFMVLGNTYESIPPRADGYGIARTVSELQAAVFGNRTGRASDGVIHDVKTLKEQQTATSESIARLDALRELNEQDLAAHKAILAQYTQGLMLEQHGISIREDTGTLETMTTAAPSGSYDVPSDLGPGVKVTVDHSHKPDVPSDLGPGVTRSTRAPSPTPQG